MRRYALISLGVAIIAAPALAQTAPTGQQLLSDWMDILRSASRILIFATSALGIVFAARSMFMAYNAFEDSERAKHLLAALFAGVITITGVVIGWISGLLIPVSG